MTTDITTDEQLIPPDAVTVHEPFGYVRLRRFMADDLEVVNAARVSFHKQSSWVCTVGEDEILVDPDMADLHDMGELRLSDADAGVLRFLALNHHGTPFEHTFFQFLVRAPIFVFREWHRHRIGISINEESARYVELRPDFYVPDEEHVRIQVGKPGRYTFDVAPTEIVQSVQEGDRRVFRTCFDEYQRQIGLGVAKEVARIVLPVGIYSTMLWACNARSLMNFLQLRNHPKALREIRDYAFAMEHLFADVMPRTHEFFLEAERQAP